MSTKTTAPETWVRIGDVGVDAGMIWLGDPCYILHRDEGQEPVDVGKDWSEFCERFHERAKDTGTAQFAYNMGHDGLGVCVNSGLGDGVYPVEARYEDDPNWGKRVAEVRIKFLPHPVLG